MKFASETAERSIREIHEAATVALGRGDLDALIRIFGRTAESTSTQIQFADASEKTQSGTYDVVITAAAVEATASGST